MSTSHGRTSGLHVIDLFAGCGGLTAGFELAGGFITVAAVEIDRAAAATFAMNHGEGVVHLADIAQWLAGDIPRADVVVGGPPCQGFSALGKQDPNDPRNALWQHYVETVRRVRPAVFVLENVPQFLKSGQFGLLLEETSPRGRLAGYELEPYMVNSNDYGIGQARRRALVLGRRRDIAPLGLPPVSNPGRTVRDELGAVAPRVRDVDLPDSFSEVLGMTIPGSFKTRQLHVTRNPNSRSVARYRSIPPGGNRFDLPDHLSTPGWRRHRSGSGDVMGRLVWTKPSVTIRTEFFKPEKGRYLHPEQDRPITHYEAALLQGFPDDYLWCGNKAEIARQIGNAVPVPLGRAVASHIRMALRHG